MFPSRPTREWWCGLVVCTRLIFVFSTVGSKPYPSSHVFVFLCFHSTRSHRKTAWLLGFSAFRPLWTYNWNTSLEYKSQFNSNVHVLSMFCSRQKIAFGLQWQWTYHSWHRTTRIQKGSLHICQKRVIASHPSIQTSLPGKGQQHLRNILRIVPKCCPK